MGKVVRKGFFEDILIKTDESFEMRRIGAQRSLREEYEVDEEPVQRPWGRSRFVCLRRWGKVRMENGELQIMQSLQTMVKSSDTAPAQLENRNKAIKKIKTKTCIDQTIWELRCF